VAEYYVGVNVEVKARALRELRGQLLEIQNISKSLSKQQLFSEIAGGGTSKSLETLANRYRTLKKEAVDFATAYTNSTARIDQSSQGLKRQADRFRELASAVKTGSAAFNIFTDAATKADFTSLFKDLKQFNAEAARTAKALQLMGMEGEGPSFGAFTSLEDLLKFKPAQTTNALQAYGNVLGDVLNQVLHGSDDYTKLAGRLREVNTELARQRQLLQDTPEAVQTNINQLSGRLITPGGTVSPPMAGPAKIRKPVGGGAAGRFAENLALGAGFPLLFGGGPGAVAGSIAGSFFGSGFGGQILGGALGQALDQAIVGAQKLGQAIATAGDSFSAVRQTGLQFNADLENTVNKYKELGKYAEANAAVQNQIAMVTGDVGGATEGITAAVTGLQSAWDGVVKAVGVTLGIIAAPFAAALALILRAVQTIFGVINFIITGVGALLKAIPGLGTAIEASNKFFVEQSQEVQDILATLDKQIDAEKKLADLAALSARYAAGSIRYSEADQKSLAIRLQLRKNAVELQKEEQRIRRENPNPMNLPSVGIRIERLIGETRRKYAAENAQFLSEKATSLYQEITNQNREIAYKRRDYELDHRDMVRETARVQEDLNREISRKAEDLDRQRLGKAAELARKEGQIRIQELENAAQRRRITGAGEVALDPTKEAVENVRAALDEYDIGRKKIDQEAADAERQRLLSILDLQIQAARFKEDTEIRIARLNIDNQRKIANINEKINRQNDAVSRQVYDRQLQVLKYQAAQSARQARVSLADIQTVTNQPTPEIKNLLDELTDAISIFERIQAEITVIQRQTPKRIPGLGALPTVGVNTQAVTAEYNALLKQIRVLEKRLDIKDRTVQLDKLQLELSARIQEEANSALQTFSSMVKEQRDQYKVQEEYSKLIAQGINPELAQELAKINIIKAERLAILDQVILELEARAVGNKALQDEVNKLKEKRRLLLEGSAAATAEAEKAQSPQKRLKDAITEVQAELNKMMDPVNQLIGLAETLGNAFGESFKGLINGSMSAQEALANLFQRTADHFLDMAARMIAAQIQMQILNIGLSFLNPAAAAANKAASAASVAQNAAALGFAGYRANGGPVSAGTPYLVGERGPELFMPRTSGSIYPNDAMGMGGANIVVNVDAGGSNVGGDPGQANQLGKVIGIAVQQELIKQKRPGGLLA